VEVQEFEAFSVGTKKLLLLITWCQDNTDFPTQNTNIQNEVVK